MEMASLAIPFYSLVLYELDGNVVLDYGTAG